MEDMKQFDSNMEKIYRAIRIAYGYDDDASALVDFAIDATLDARRKIAQKEEERGKK